MPDLANIDHNDRWTDAARIAGIPPPLESWLAEPGLLSDRVRQTSGDTVRFRLLHQGPALLDAGARRRLGIADPCAHERRGEFHLDGRRWIATQSLFPQATLADHPWLADIGGAMLGERLRGVAQVAREPFEYLELLPGHPLARLVDAAADARAREFTAWARRAVHRIDGRPLLVTEVFGTAMLAGARAAPQMPSRAG